MTKTDAASPDLQMRIATLEKLSEQLQKASSASDKLKIIDSFPSVKNYLSSHSEISEFLLHLNDTEKLTIKSLLAIEQGDRVFKQLDLSDKTHIQTFLQSLVEVERAYATIGGIVGYYLTVLKLIETNHVASSASTKELKYSHPPGLDFTKDSLEMRKAIRWGIESLPTIAEMYPVGGAGDRLDLHSEMTGEALPAALLSFCGKTLLEGLVRDLQAREYLCYKLTGKQVISPIAMMTSHEKENHHYITKICRDHQWFGRGEDHFRFFVQPLVPVVTIHGDLVVHDAKLAMKPGGHGVIWICAKEAGIFEWFTQKGYRHALVRQINNPIAGLDNGLCAFEGWGVHQQKIFGFASCPRVLNTAEGMDVLVESKTKDGFAYRITNIEYTEFEKHGVHDIPTEAGSPYSTFPANTNILFVDLKAISSLIEKSPIPGMLINMKNKITYQQNGETHEVAAGRLESTMQNIADHIVNVFPKQLVNPSSNNFSTYVVYNERLKTISVTKKSYTPGSSISETPEGCFYDLQQNYGTLLKQYCQIEVPELGSQEQYLESGPGFLFLFHPALGPFFQIIGQKIQRGRFKEGFELQLEISEVVIQDLQLDGSLIIHAEAVLGENRGGKIYYGENSGKCTLSRVVVMNKGIDRKRTRHYWRNQFVRKEEMRIILHGNAEFFAEDVVFQGNVHIEVPDGHRMVAYMEDGQVRYRMETISVPTWYWKYSFDAGNYIRLEQRRQ